MKSSFHSIQTIVCEIAVIQPWQNFIWEILILIKMPVSKENNHVISLSFNMVLWTRWLNSWLLFFFLKRWYWKDKMSLSKPLQYTETVWCKTVYLKKKVYLPFRILILYFVNLIKSKLVSDLPNLWQNSFSF